MSYYNTPVQNVPGFSQTQYDQLVDLAQQKNIPEKDVAGLLVGFVNGYEMSFSEALSAVRNQWSITLPPPLGKSMALIDMSGVLPSMGANVMALITETASEERRRSAEQRAMQTEIIAETIIEQAGDMRAKAATQLALGIVSGTFSIAQGAWGVKMMKDGLKAMQGQGRRMEQRSQMALNQEIATFNSAASGVVGLVNTISQSVGGFMDANIKQKDAVIERARAMADALKTLEDGMQEVIHKALASMDAIQNNTNQTRTKILG